MPLNETRSPTIQVECVCRGRIPSCHRCNATGKVTKKSCVDCGGIGKEALGSTVICRGCRGAGVSPFADGVDSNEVIL